MTFHPSTCADFPNAKLKGTFFDVRRQHWPSSSSSKGLYQLVRGWKWRIYSGFPMKTFNCAVFTVILQLNYWTMVIATGVDRQVSITIACIICTWQNSTTWTWPYYRRHGSTIKLFSWRAAECLHKVETKGKQHNKSLINAFMLLVQDMKSRFARCNICNIKQWDAMLNNYVHCLPNKCSVPRPGQQV